MTDLNQNTDASTMSTAGANSSGSGGTIDQGVFTPGSFIREIQKQQNEVRFVAKAIFATINEAACFMSYSAVMLFRWTLGERTLSKTGLASTWLVASFVAVTSGVDLAYGIAMAMPVMYAVHAYRTRRRNKRGERLYSYSRGTSWLDKLIPNRPYLTAGVLEPLILISAAVFVFLFGDQMMVTLDSEHFRTEAQTPEIFSIYLAAMGLGLAFVESRLRKQHRDMLLTHIDQQIMSKYIASALDETAEIEDEGFAVAELPKWNPKQLGLLGSSGLPSFSKQSDTDGSFDPAWDNLLDAPAPGSA
ncbi:MAG: hypothetical protein AAGH88_03265 [Planctomycetota bacterium]